MDAPKPGAKEKKRTTSGSRLDSLETGRSNKRSARSKGAEQNRRVSQQRELAVVTLGTVASTARLGDLLAGDPPSWATVSETSALEAAA